MKSISRRTLLRGIGAAIALPALDAMLPAFSTPAKSARRLVYIYVPNGIMMPQWTPATDGAAYDFPRILQPLEPYRDNLLVLSGLTHNTGRPLGDGDGDHARAAATYLTGVHPKKTDGTDIHAGISVDQIAAQNIGTSTKFASLELACEDGRLVGACDIGYSCAYSNSIAWRTPSTPLPPEINPRLVFERLFGAEDENPADRSRRLRDETSILDYVLDDASRLSGKLGVADRRKIDEYLSAVREIERRIQLAEQDNRQITPSIQKPQGYPASFDAYVKLMFDLLTVAFQTDLTRVSTFMMAREGSTRAYREIGVSDAHHPLTHHRGNLEWIEKVSRINTYHIEQFGYFLGKLRATPEGESSLLDNTVIVYGSGLSDGDRHDHADLPVLVAGGGLGGRHIRYSKETPMNNLHLTLLDRLGVQTDSFGDSSGELQYLSDLG